MLKRIGTMNDGREVYIDEDKKLWAKNEIPTQVFGPTHKEIKQFEEEHADAEACPECGFKYYVNIFGVYLAFEDGICRVCGIMINPNWREDVTLYRWGHYFQKLQS